MRIAGILLNILLIIVVVALVIDDGWPNQLEEQLMVCVFFAAPITSLIALWTGGANDSETWLSLFLQRKKLEEKAKLNKLKSIDD